MFITQSIRVLLISADVKTSEHIYTVSSILFSTWIEFNPSTDK